MSEIDYKRAASAARLTEDQLRLIEQLFDVDNAYDRWAAQINVYSSCEAIGRGEVTLVQVEMLLAQQKEIERAIRDAFSGVTREGGTSWSEGWAIDGAKSEQECREARASDTESSCEELIDDPKWYYENGPWAFLDAVGFRYYVAPALIRSLRCSRFVVDYYLEHPPCEEELQNLLTVSQVAAISRALHYSLDMARSFGWSKCDVDDSRRLCEKWDVMKSRA